MKLKFLITGLFVVGLMFTGFSVDAMGGETHLVGKDGVVTNQLKYTQTLRRGTVNANVLALQKKLKAFGFYHKLLDSDYGSGTIAAVKEFQRAKGLKDDGIAGPKTYAMILATNASALSNYASFSDSKKCTKEYVPVCGRITSPHANESPVLRTFSNKCLLEEAGEQVSFLYKGKCELTKPTVSDGYPIVETNLVSRITDESAMLHGEVELNGLRESGAFFVYGQSLGKIEDVTTMYGSYGQIVEQAESLMKKYAHDVNYGDDEDFQVTITGLDESEGFYYRACVDFETSNGNDETIACGDVEKFSTFSEDGPSSTVIRELIEKFESEIDRMENRIKDLKGKIKELKDRL